MTSVKALKDSFLKDYLEIIKLELANALPSFNSNSNRPTFRQLIKQLVKQLTRMTTNGANSKEEEEEEEEKKRNRMKRGEKIILHV